MPHQQWHSHITLPIFMASAMHWLCNSHTIALLLAVAATVAATATAVAAATTSSTTVQLVPPLLGLPHLTQRLQPTKESYYAFHGDSVAISSAGVVVAGSKEAGALIFTINETHASTGDTGPAVGTASVLGPEAWVEAAHIDGSSLTPPLGGSISARLGSVAIDGSIVAMVGPQVEGVVYVMAPHNSSGSAVSGLAANTSAWANIQQIANLTLPATMTSPPSATFSLALGYGGRVLVVGSPLATPNGTKDGAALVYMATSSTGDGVPSDFVLTHVLAPPAVPSCHCNQNSGDSVSIHDGVLVVASREATYVYVVVGGGEPMPGSEWQLQASITPGEGKQPTGAASVHSGLLVTAVYTSTFSSVLHCYTYSQAAGWALVALLEAASEAGSPDDGNGMGALSGSLRVGAGGVIVAGANGDDDVSQNAGAAFVFTRAGTSNTWQQVAKMAPAVADNTMFGWAVDVTTLDSGQVALVVGAPNAKAPIGTNLRVGATFLATQSAGVTMEAHTLQLTSYQIQRTGQSLGKVTNSSWPGRPLVLIDGPFVMASPKGLHDDWVQVTELISPELPTSSNNFGAAAVMAGDVAILGGPKRDDSKGAAYLYIANHSSPRVAGVPSQWQYTYTFMPPNPNQVKDFGCALALHGTTLMIGASRAGYGRVTVYELAAGSSPRNGSAWVATSTLTSNRPGFGTSIALDERTAVVGAISNSYSAVLVFTRGNSGYWALEATLTVPGPAGVYLGNSVALHGSTIVAGAPRATIGGATRAGAAYVWERVVGPVVDPSTAGCHAAGTAVSAAYTLTGVLVAPEGDAVASDDLGQAVAVQGDTVAVGSQSIVLLFTRSGAPSAASAAATSSWVMAARVAVVPYARRTAALAFGPSWLLFSNSGDVVERFLPLGNGMTAALVTVGRAGPLGPSLQEAGCIRQPWYRPSGACPALLLPPAGSSGSNAAYSLTNDELWCDPAQWTLRSGLVLMGGGGGDAATTACAAKACQATLMVNQLTVQEFGLAVANMNIIPLTQDAGGGSSCLPGASVDGGLLHWAPGTAEGRLGLVDCVLSGGEARRGGCVYGANGVISMRGTSLQGCSAATGGGVFAEQEATVIVHGGTFSSNVATQLHGGTFAVSVATLQLLDVAVTNSSALQDGGAVHVGFSASLTVTDCHFSTGSARVGNGGAVAVAAGGVHSVASSFVANSAGGSGGAVFGDSQSTVVWCGTNATGNKAAVNGGALVVQGGSVEVLAGSKVADNNAQVSGGGVACNLAGRVEVHQSQVQGNTAEQAGGGLHADHCTLNITATVFDANSVTGTANAAMQHGGGGLYASAAYVAQGAGGGASGSAVSLGAGTVFTSSNSALRGAAVLLSSDETAGCVGNASRCAALPANQAVTVAMGTTLQGPLLWLGPPPMLQDAASLQPVLHGAPVTLVPRAGTWLPRNVSTNERAPAMELVLVDSYGRATVALAGTLLTYAVDSDTTSTTDAALVGGSSAPFDGQGVATVSSLTLLAPPGTRVALTLDVTPSQGLQPLRMQLDINLCPPGSQLGADGVSCVQCRAGTASPVANALPSACKACSGGVSSAGSTTCQPCPPGSEPDAAGERCSLCGSASASNGTSCDPCPAGQVADDTAAACTMCGDGKVRTVDAARCVRCPLGHYATADHTRCVACPLLGVQCTDGLLVVLEGWWRPGEATGTGTPGNGTTGGVTNLEASTVFYRCPAEACLPGAGGSVSCAPGRTGPLCAVCKDDHFLQGTSCLPCPASRGAAYTAVGAMALVGVGFWAFTVHRASTQWKREQQQAGSGATGGAGRGAVAKKDASVVPVLKIMLNYLQVTSFMNDFEIPWPAFVANMWSASGSASSLPLTSSFLSCALPITFYTKVWLVLVAPLIATVVLLVIPAAHTWCMRGRHTKAQQPRSKVAANGGSDAGEHNGTWTTYGTAVLVTVYLLYPSICREVVRVLDCSAPIAGVSYLEADFHLPCGDATHTFHVLIALVVMACFCLGFPIGVALMLRHRRASGRLGKGRLQFLHSGYKARFCYWESAVLARKFGLVAAGAALSGSGRGHQTYVALLVLLLCLVAQMGAQPYVSAAQGRLELVSLMASSATLYLGLLFVLGALGEAGKTVAVTTLVLVNGAFVLWLLVQLIRRLWVSKQLSQAAVVKGSATGAAIVTVGHDVELAKRGGGGTNGGSHTSKQRARQARVSAMRTNSQRVLVANPLVTNAGRFDEEG